MFRDLIVNLSFIISFLFLAGQIFKENPIQQSTANQIKAGLFAGLTGIILMDFSIQITETLLVDLRLFAIMLATAYGGLTTSVVTGVVLILARVLIFGVNPSSIGASILIIVMVTSCILIQRLKIQNSKQWLYMNLCNILFATLLFLILIDDQQILLKTTLYYGIISVIGGYVTFYISEYIAKSNEYLRLLKESSTKDFLTGLNNVRQFDESWNTHLKTAIAKKEYLSLLIIDIDFFKRVNDTYGHPVGDFVLKELGNVLLSSTRTFDTISRNGGEEFSVILPDCPNQQAIEIAERIRRSVEKHEFLIHNGNTLRITVSIGVASYPETVNDTEQIIKQADQCLYMAKHSGRNKVCS